MEAALVGRFRDALETLIGAAPARVGIAVSGGPDSLALLLLAHAALGERISAATVDHRLRAESGDEARQVSDICTDLGVPHAILPVSVPITGNLQAGARVARYALLEEWRRREGLDWVATAHHADDQIETVVMRLLRGSGVEGLTAVRPINGRVIRPLLGFRKRELEGIIEASGVAPVNDPSNRDDRFDRVRIRGILSGLEFDPARLERSTGALLEACGALAWAELQAAREQIAFRENEAELDPDGLPPELLRRLVVRCLEHVDSEIHPAGPALDALLRSLESGHRRTLGGVVCTGGERWLFSPAPPRKTG